MSSSSSSISSSFSLNDRARTILELLCNGKDFDSASDMIHPSVVIQHNDDLPHESRAAFLDTWKLTAERMPDFEMQIREAVVDDRQRKVWVRSEIRGLPGGIVKESIDMMTFDDEGLLIRSEDCQRIRKVD